MAKKQLPYKPLREINRRFKSIKLNNHLKKRVQSDIIKWYNSNGEAYTVQRLKFVRQCCVKYLAEGTLPPKDAEVWMKRNKSGLLYGHWGTLMKLMNTQPQEVLTLLSCYTVFVQQTGPTEKQICKFKQAIEEPFLGDSVKLESLEKRLFKNSKKVLKRYLGNKHPLLNSDVPLPGNYVLKGRFRNESHKTDVHLKAIDALNDFNFVSKVSRYPWIDDVFGYKLYSGADFVLPFQPVIKPMSIGNINWIMEPGIKERIVTDFSKPLEHLTMPIGNRLYDIVEEVPWDATFDEFRGYDLIQEALQRGETCYCFDLSKATDRFPYSLQRAVLNSLDLGANYHDMLSILNDAVTGLATLPNGQCCQWTVGQPMGAFPSFAMFTLTHGMILMEYLYSHGVEYRGQFVVHGDDIVIMDKNLAHYYIEFTKIAGIEVNQFKSIVSNTVAEFNSRLIRANDFLYLRKWRPVTFENIGDQVLFWGPSAFDWMDDCGKRTVSDIRYLLSLPGVLPNGVSINPYGKSLSERLAYAPEGLQEFITSKSSSLSNFISYRELANSLLRGNRFFSTDDSDGSTYHQFGFTEQAVASYVLQEHLGCLDLADALDREILADCWKFANYFSNDKLYQNHLVMSTTANWDIHHHATFMFANIAHMLKHFNDVWCPNKHKVSFKFIRQADKKRSVHKAINTSRLRKILDEYRSKKHTDLKPGCLSITG